MTEFNNSLKTIAKEAINYFDKTIPDMLPKEVVKILDKVLPEKHKILLYNYIRVEVKDEKISFEEMEAQINSWLDQFDEYNYTLYYSGEDLIELIQSELYLIIDEDILDKIWKTRGYREVYLYKEDLLETYLSLLDDLKAGLLSKESQVLLANLLETTNIKNYSKLDDLSDEENELIKKGYFFSRLIDLEEMKKIAIEKEYL